jgi:hypothetical protein
MGYPVAKRVCGLKQPPTHHPQQEEAKEVKRKEKSRYSHTQNVSCQK